MKNGVAIALTDGTEAVAITAIDNNVYVGGYEDKEANIALYWKNGVPIPLPDGTNNAEATSIVVSGNNVS